MSFPQGPEANCSAKWTAWSQNKERLTAMSVDHSCREFSCRCWWCPIRRNLSLPVIYCASRISTNTTSRRSDLLKPLFSHQQVTWWRFQEWAVLCQPAHTSSSPWTGGTGQLYKVPRVHSRGWRWPVEDAAELHPARSVAPGHKRELSLKPWETHSIQRQHLFHHKHTLTTISVAFCCPLSCDPAGSLSSV